MTSAAAFPDDADDSRARTLAHRLLLRRRHARARRRAAALPRPERQLLQAARRDHQRLGRHLVAQARHVRRQRPHPLHPRPRSARIELRAADGSANPYLALAAVVHAGLDGIERSADPGDPCGPGESRESSAVAPPHAAARRAGAPRRHRSARPIDDGHGVATYFADAKEEEFLGWHNTVTDWEIDRYLTAY